MGTDKLKEMLNAIWDHDTACIRQLVAEGVELNRFYDEKAEGVLMFSPALLGNAVNRGDLATVECLLDLGADLTLAELDVLSKACEWPDILKLLISRGADVRKRFNDNKDSLITYICRQGPCWGEPRIESIAILLQAGCNINFRDGVNGETALHYAVEFRDEELADALINRFGAAGDLVALYSGSSCTYTALQYALGEEHYEIAEIIIKGQMNFDVQCPLTSQTALHIAVHPLMRRHLAAMQLKIVGQLLKRCTPDMRDNDYMTPLAEVCLRSYLHKTQAMPLIKLLTDHGANPRAMVGLDPCEPLTAKVMRNENKVVIPEVLEFFKQFL